MDDIKPFAALRLTGADRIAFLQGQLSNDLRQLHPDQPLLAGWSNPQGRLLCTVWVVDWQEAVWLLLPAELAESVAKRLRMFVLRAAVQIGIADTAPQLLITADVINHIKPENSSLSYCYYDDKSYTLNLCPGAAIRLHSTPSDAGPLDPGLYREWQLQLIRDGIPVIWAQTSGEFVPQMVNLDLLGGISFTKGCYVGQEIVARTQNLGRIKRRMFAYTTGPDLDTQPGQAVFAESAIAGQIVSCVRGPESTELLAVIKLDCVGLPLSLEQNGSAALSRMPLPYAVPEAVPEQTD